MAKYRGVSLEVEKNLINFGDLDSIFKVTRSHRRLKNDFLAP